ncbi:VOC family protein [Streptomyces sp. NPDC057638]|uniref:VOC family protein n=1 Tax=Streptomyces sp. NPDC057638 TaxID=3346190 RepID=UPI0036ACB5C4
MSEQSAPSPSSPSVCPSMLYADARAAVRQLTEAFGFTTVALFEDESGLILHAELALGNGIVMLGSKGAGGEFGAAMAGAGPAAVYVRVDDVDAHHRRAVEHGVEVVAPPTDQEYGARDYLARDREGHIWSFGDYRPQIAAV